MLSFNSPDYLLMRLHPNVNQNFENKNSFFDLQIIPNLTTEETIKHQLNESLNSSKVLCNKTEETKNRSLISELDIKYSLIFILNFQVILFNALIIAHVLKAKHFQKSSSARFFVASLALSDMLVGIMVMPIGIISLMEDTWLFGKEMCIYWQSIDFFSCTASIFNLCTISLDRYIAISKPLFYMRIEPTRVLLIIAIVWFVSALITFPPIIAERIQKGELYLDRICKGPNCSNCGSLLDLYPVYVVLSTIFSFFVPVLIVIVTNYRTYLIVKRHAFARANNGRICSIPSVSKKKPKKLKFFQNLFVSKIKKNDQIELDLLKNQSMPIVLPKNQPHHYLCHCNEELSNDQTYLHITTRKRNLRRIAEFYYFFTCRNCSNFYSKIFKLKIKSQRHHDSQHPSYDTQKPEHHAPKSSESFFNCYTLSNLSNSSDRKIEFSSFESFPNNNSFNLQILDDYSNMDNMTCVYCSDGILDDENITTKNSNDSLFDKIKIGRPINSNFLDRSVTNRSLRNENKIKYIQQSQVNRCSHPCKLCLLECEDCKNDFDQLFVDIFDSKTNKVVSKNILLNSKSDFKNSFNKMSYSKKKKSSHDDNTSNLKILHSNRFNKTRIIKNLPDMNFSRINCENQKYYEIKLQSDKNNSQIKRHHIHSHIQHSNNNRFEKFDVDLVPDSIKKQDSLRHTANRDGKCDKSSPPTTSDYKHTDFSLFDYELRINCGTGQLQKSIGLRCSRSYKSQNSGDIKRINQIRSARKFKKLAYIASNSIRNVGFRISSPKNNRLNTIKREFKATKTLTIITFIFVCMWLPYFTIFFLEAICKDCFLVKKYFSPFLSHCLFLGWSNSYVNCLLYMYFSRKLRISIINSLLCRKN